MVSVKYENIGIAYGDFVAVRNIDLEIPDGEITTLLGPSGCGKTTLLRSLAGFVDPFEGSIILGDKDVTLLPPQRRNTAMIFQNYALWPHMTIFKNVEYGLKLRLKEKIIFVTFIDEDKISDISFSSYGSPQELVDIAEKLKDYAKNKTTEEIWSLDLEEIKTSIIQSDEYSDRYIRYVYGALKDSIRDHYQDIQETLPSWLPERPTRDEKIKLWKPWYTYLFWLTRPFFIFFPETFKRVNKRIKNEQKEYYRKNPSILAKVPWFFQKLWKYISYPLSESKKVYLDKKALIDPDWKFRREKVHNVLKLVHLLDQADKHPPALSGGQQQRIALARSIVVEPDVLLCDEPLSNLDAKLRTELRTEIRSIIKNIGMTAVYVTHDQAEALAISDRIAVMNVGYIEQYGKPTEVFTDPHTLFVAEFIGESTTMEGTYNKDSTAVLKGGEEIKIDVEKDLTPNSKLSVNVRPDSVSIKDNGGFPLEIEIHTLEYLGKELKLTGKLEDGTILLVDVVDKIEKTAERDIGDKITVYIDPKDLFIFDEEGKRVY